MLGNRKIALSIIFAPRCGTILKGVDVVVCFWEAAGQCRERRLQIPFGSKCFSAHSSSQKCPVL